MVIQMSNIPEIVAFQHKGYILKQYNDILHCQIINESGKTVYVVPCAEKLTQESASKMIDDFIAQKEQKKNNHKKVCPICGKEFWASKANVKYCSKACNIKNYDILDKMNRREVRIAKQKEKALLKEQQIAEPKYKIKNCKCCGKPFKATNHNRTYCSNGCKLKAKYLREETYYERKKHKKNKIGRPKGHKDSLCWYCEKACGGCSWSRKLIPVEGWKAKKVKNKDYNDETIPCYKVIECPEFVEGR